MSPWSPPWGRVGWGCSRTPVPLHHLVGVHVEGEEDAFGFEAFEGVEDGAGGGAFGEFDEDVVAPAVGGALDGAGDRGRGSPGSRMREERGRRPRRILATTASRSSPESDDVDEAAEGGVARLVALGPQVLVVARRSRGVLAYTMAG